MRQARKMSMMKSAECPWGKRILSSGPGLSEAASSCSNVQFLPVARSCKAIWLAKASAISRQRSNNICQLTTGAIAWEQAGMIRAVLLLLLALAGCVTPRQQASACRPFEFEKDTFAFPNELVWVYEYDSHGKWTTHDRDPPPTYWQHCFVL